MEKLHITVKNLPSSEQPYEKLEHQGSETLSDAELLAIIIRTSTNKERSVDVAYRLLNKAEKGNGLLALNQMTLKELMEINGIGKVKAIQLKAVAELAKRISKADRSHTSCFTSPRQIADYYMEDMRHLQHEEILLIMMNTKNQIIKEERISVGTVNASILSPREVYVHALSNRAVHIVLLHNHPSGDPTPSREDIQITGTIKKAGELIGIGLMDHIIIGDNKYISLKEKGFL